MITVILFSILTPHRVTVADVLQDPEYYTGKKVELSGVIMEYDESPDEFVCYLKGDHDSVIPVVLRAPLHKIYCRFEVTGIVHRDPYTGYVFLEELQGVLSEDVEVNLTEKPLFNGDITASLEVE